MRCNNTKMVKSVTRTYSRHSREAITLLGGLIRAARKECKLTLQEVADRAGISRGMTGVNDSDPDLHSKIERSGSTEYALQHFSG